MRIENYLNTTRQEVEDKSFNIWIGISLGNKYFTKEHIRAYLQWALEYTKTDVLVVISDVLHAINLQILDKKSSVSALRKAKKMGDAKYFEVMEVISELSPEKQNKIHIVRWGDITNTEQYQHNLETVKNEYVLDREFREHIRHIVRSGRQDRTERIGQLTEQELDELCGYILSEIPLFIDGVQLNSTFYTLIPYPGLTELDKLFISLQNKDLFPELAKKLKITKKIAILDAYAS